MFTAQGPTVRELAAQALSSVERGYDMLAPKFDHTPFRTPDLALTATADVLAALGPYGRGLDLCCGTGAGVDVLREVCREEVVGVDFSAGMLEVARSEARDPRGPVTRWVRADAMDLPFAAASFELIVNFGALGHFLPARRPALFAGVHRLLGPGGRFVLPLAAPARPGTRGYWALWGFDAAMRVRNALWRPPFVMYYRTMRLARIQQELREAGFTVELHPLPPFGHRPDGSPYARLVVARRPPEDAPASSHVSRR